MADRQEERFAKLVEWVAAIAGPLTVLTALLYYFGWTRTNAVFRYFGVDPALLKFELPDYLARAAGPAFAPAVVLIVGSALLFGLTHAALRLELACLRHPVTVRGRVLVVRGPSVTLIYLAVIALWCAARVALALPDYLHIGAATGLTDPIPAALALAGGAVLLTVGIRLLLVRPEGTPTRLPDLPVQPRILVAAAILAATFWATAAYSQQTGESLASSIDRNPTAQPEVTVYSTESLRLWSAAPPALAAEPGEETHFHYAYTGLRLLIYANDRWVLLTGEHGARGHMAVVVLPDDDAIRVRLSS